jgi:hypothetical protein
MLKLQFEELSFNFNQQTHAPKLLKKPLLNLLKRQSSPILL